MNDRNARRMARYAPKIVCYGGLCPKKSRRIHSVGQIPSLTCYDKSFSMWAVFKTSIKTEWKLFILARNPCAILARPQMELARGQFFKLSLRDLARRWFPEIWCVFACAMQARSWFRTWVSWLLRFSARSVVSQLLDFLACPVASRLLGSNQRSSHFASSVVPECLQWVYGLEPGYNQYSGMALGPCSGFAYCPAQKEHSSKM